jgi:tetratricopeptide (TPR) repeat protein
MVRLVSTSRVALLAAALMAGCAAGGPADGAAPAEDAAPARVTAYGGYLAGRYATSQADTGPAADQLLAALRLAPGEAEVLNRAFVAAVLDGRAEAARLARSLPQNELAVMLLAGADAMAGRWDRAESRLRALPRQGTAQVLQPLLLAWAQAGRGNTDAALATLRPQLEATNRIRGLAALHGAMIADLANRRGDAERLARQALGSSSEPNLRLIQITAGILERSGKQAEAAKLVEGLALAGEEMALLGTPEARRQLLQGRAVTSPVEGMAEAELALAGALRGQAAPELTLMLARLALRLRPDFTPTLMIAADSLTDERRHAEGALALLSRVPAEDPLAPIVTLRRAVLLDRLDRPQEAIDLLQALSAARPEAPQPPARLGDLLRSRERYAEAVTAYDTALSRTGTPSAANWVLFYARGIALERSGNWGRAEGDLRTALQLAPEQPYVLNYLGYSWVEKGENLAEARAMLERAAALRPQDGNVADSLGWALFKLGDLPGALQWMERASELESRNSVINDHLGDVYWAAGRQDEARFQWRRALELDPEPGDGPRISAKLRDGMPAPASTPATATP